MFFQTDIGNIEQKCDALLSTIFTIEKKFYSIKVWSDTKT
jgi:hypothetical protein